MEDESFLDALGRIIQCEVAASKQLEEIVFEQPNVVAFCTELALERQ